MKNGQFKLHLRATDDEAFTELRLSGSVVTALPPSELQSWMRQLSNWTGVPVELVLAVDAGSVAWFELWGDALYEIPARHLEIRFAHERPDRHRRRRDVG